VGTVVGGTWSLFAKRLHVAETETHAAPALADDRSAPSPSTVPAATTVPVEGVAAPPPVSSATAMLAETPTATVATPEEETAALEAPNAPIRPVPPISKTAPLLKGTVRSASPARTTTPSPKTEPPNDGMDQRLRWLERDLHEESGEAGSMPASGLGSRGRPRSVGSGAPASSEVPESSTSAPRVKSWIR